MVASSLSQLLTQKEVLLADGATGTNFFNLGLGPGDPPEFWNVDAPEKVTDLHQAFVDAGADIILTNTFGANAMRLKLHQAQDRVFELNEAGAKLAKQVACAANKPVVVGGSVGPTGELLEPLGSLTYKSAVESFTEQITALKHGGVNVIWIETMSASDEMQAAAEAADSCHMPYVVTASFDTAGKTMMGLEPNHMLHLFNKIENPPIAVGANCGVGASDLLLSILSLSQAAENEIIIAKANCGIPEISGDQVCYTGTPKLMADYVRLAVNAGARIIGGCCGTTPQHLTAMRQALDMHIKSKQPVANEIIEIIGPFVNQTETKLERKRRRNRRSN